MPVVLIPDREVDLNVDWEAEEPFAPFIAPAPYWASVSAKKKLRCLHKSDVCAALKWRCRSWEEVHALDTAEEDSRCRRCFPPDSKTAPASSGEEDSASSSDEETVA